MEWPARVATSRHKKSAQRAYLQACLHIAPHHPAQPVSWWGLCALLSRHYLHRGAIRTQPELWTELFPFLLVGDEKTAERAVEEYLVYLDDPRAADVEWLGIQINRALEQADSWNGSIAAVIRQPALVFEARWMALLAYQTLLRLRRAVVLYDSDFAHSHRPSYWHGLAGFDDVVSKAVRRAGRDRSLVVKTGA